MTDNRVQGDINVRNLGHHFFLSFANILVLGGAEIRLSPSKIEVHQIVDEK